MASREELPTRGSLLAPPFDFLGLYSGAWFFTCEFEALLMSSSRAAVSNTGFRRLDERLSNSWGGVTPVGSPRRAERSDVLGRTSDVRITLD